jgi:hypothetical protein
VEANSFIVAACWMIEGLRIPGGIQVPSKELTLENMRIGHKKNS